MNTSGRNPAAAAPAAIPTVTASAPGVLRTRDGPNRSNSPRVSAYEPPCAAMSWPSRITRGSRSISSAVARANASRKNSLGIEQCRLGIGPGGGLRAALGFRDFGVHLGAHLYTERIIQDRLAAQPLLVQRQRVPIAQLLQF